MILKENGTEYKTKYYTGSYEKEITPEGERELHYIGGSAIYVTNNDGSSDMYYIYKDHLGSITNITDDEGTVIESLSYDAWGNRRNPDTWEYDNNLENFLFDRGFTGHEHLDDFAIINMNGRIYDPLTGRMMAPDNYVQSSLSQNLNRYSYCMNNPLVYTDPDGEFIFTLATLIAAPFTGGSSLAFLPAAIGADLGVWAGGSAVNGTMNPFQWDYSNGKTWAGMGVGAIAGGVGGGIGSGAIGGLSGMEAAMVGGMGAGAINGGGMTAIAGGNFSDVMGGMIQGAVIGGFSGALSYGAGSFLGDFSGVAGSGFKNAMYELGHSALKGSAQGLAGGAMLSIINQDASYLWKGATFGAGFGIGVASLRIATMGSAFIPDPDIYCEFEDFGQVYRRGSIFTPRGAGITLGRNVVTKLTGNTDYDRYLLHHETGHLSQIDKMGAFSFYSRTAKEYSKYGMGTVYRTYGTLEYGAEQYAFDRLGYVGVYYRGIGPRIYYTFP